MKKNIYITVLVLSLIFPVVSFAALDGLKGLIVEFGNILKLIVPVLFGLALIFFFWGLTQFILNAGEAEAREDGKQRMLWGIVALFVIVSIYGILGFIGGAVGINTGNRGGGPSTGVGGSGGGGLDGYPLCEEGYTGPDCL